MKKRKIFLVLVILAALLVIAVAVALNLNYDSPELGRAILSRLGAGAGLEIEAEGFQLHPLRGVQLKKVRVAGDLLAGQLTATAEELVLKHRFWPLLGGDVVVDEVVLRKPTVELHSSAAPEPSPSPEGAGESTEGESTVIDSGESGDPEGGLSLNIDSFRIVDGSLRLRTETAATDDGGEGTVDSTEIDGLDLELRQIVLDPAAPSAILGLSASGEISADEVRTAAATGTDAKGTLSLAGGHFLVEEFQFPTPPGRLMVGKLDVDLTQDPFTYQLSAAGQPLNTNMILGAAQDGGFGSAYLALEATGDGSESGNLRGGGVLKLDPGVLPVMPILAQLEQLFVGTTIIGADYQPCEIRFSLQGDVLKIEPFEIVAGELKLGAFGDVNFASGAVDLHMSLNAPREQLEVVDVPEEILELLTDAEGRTHLLVQVGGSQLSPSVAFDKSQWKELARKRVESEVQKGIEKELGKALGKLFGGSDGL